MLYQAYKLGWAAADKIFPPQCGGCGRWGSRWCANCRQQVRPITGATCARCGIPIQEHENKQCRRCQTESRSFAAVRSWAFFEGPVQRAVHKLKYQRDFGLAERLSRELIRLVKSWQPEFELVTVVPLDQDRYRQRGFNQALLLAKPVAWAAGRPCRPEAVFRIRRTVSQVGLTRSQRISNVHQAFQADGKFVRGCAVLIIDDVMTTGATIEASSRALKEAGAEKVYGLTLARSVLA